MLIRMYIARSCNYSFKGECYSFGVSFLKYHMLIRYYKNKGIGILEVVQDCCLLTDHRLLKLER